MFTAVFVIGVFCLCIYVLANYVTRRENAYYNSFPGDPEPDDYLTDEEYEREQAAFDKQYPEY